MLNGMTPSMQMRPQVIKRNLNDFVGFLHGSANGQGVLDMGTIESLITLTEFLLSEHGIAGMYDMRICFSNFSFILYHFR